MSKPYPTDGLGRTTPDTDDDEKHRGEKVNRKKVGGPRKRKRRPKTEPVIASPKAGV